MDLGLDSPEIKTLYEELRQPLISWLINKYHIDLDLAIDIYQDAFIILIEKMYIDQTVILGNNTKQKTYLYGIAKNKTREHLRKRSKVSSLTETQLALLADEPNDPPEAHVWRIEQAAKAFDLLGKSCQKLLMMAVVHKVSMQDIALKLHYQNANTAKSRKYKCLQALRKRFSQLTRTQND